MDLTDSVNEAGFTNEIENNLNVVRDDAKLQHYIQQINHNLPVEAPEGSQVVALLSGSCWIQLGTRLDASSKE